MTSGSYRPGSSFIHRVDPRVKLVLLVSLVACLFASSHQLRLVLIACLWLVAAFITKGGLRDLWRVFKMMRWLILFTLLLHVFFTPGKTFFGSSWLSYDGLIRGLIINSQLILAILFSFLLSWTTRPVALSQGLTSLLAPLQVFKVPVRETSELLLLVLHVFPFIEEELAKEKIIHEQRQAKGFKALKNWVSSFEPLLVRLFNRADQLAIEIASGDSTVGCLDNEADLIFDFHAFVVLISGIVVIYLLWQV